MVAVVRIRKVAVVSRSAVRTIRTIPPAGGDVAVEHHIVDGVRFGGDLILLDERSNYRFKFVVREESTGLARLVAEPAAEYGLRSVLVHGGGHSVDDLVVGPQSLPIRGVSDVPIADKN